MGKHSLRAAGEFVRERFRDGCPKIIARLIEDAPGQIQRPATWRPVHRSFSEVGSFAWTITGLPLKFPDRLITRCLSGPRLSTFDSRLMMFHTLNLFRDMGQRLSKPSYAPQRGGTFISARTKLTTRARESSSPEETIVRRTVVPAEPRIKAIAWAAFPP